MVHVPFCNERSTKEVPFLSKWYKCIQKVDFEMEHPIYNTPTPHLCNKRCSNHCLWKKGIIKTKSAKGLSDEYQCKFQFAF